MDGLATVVVQPINEDMAAFLPFAAGTANAIVEGGVGGGGVDVVVAAIAHAK